jgi:DNA-binding NarL/FixJ family response regulator
MKKHRVLVVEEDSIFSSGVVLLLVLQECLEIIEKTPADTAQIKTQVDDLQPDVVVISDAFGAAQSQFVLELLNGHPSLRVVVFSQQGNRINILNNREIMVESIEDLVTAISAG